MGYFAELVICDLKEVGDGITPHIEMIQFRDKTFVSWQSERVPSKNKWQGLAHQTIFFKKPGDVIFDRDVYEAKNMIKKIKSGIIKKSEKYEFTPHFEHLPPASLIHIVLPDFHIPNIDSFREFIPHLKKKGSRLALTWPFESRLRTKFYFHKVSERKFNNFKSAGMDLEVKIDPQLRESLQLRGIEMKEEVKDFAASAAAKFIHEYASS